MIPSTARGGGGGTELLARGGAQDFGPGIGIGSMLAFWPIADISRMSDAARMSEDNLTWLSQWYLSQCDNDWEHCYGIQIGTLDNPGWLLKIDLTDTILEGHSFQRVEHGTPAQDLDEWKRVGPWWVAEVKDGAFRASCGPADLAEVIALFRRWSQSPPLG